MHFHSMGRQVYGFILIERGIEANLDICEAVIEMKAPTTKKDIQRLHGILISLNRFISRSAQQAMSFYKLLRKRQNLSEVRNATMYSSP